MTDVIKIFGKMRLVLLLTLFSSVIYGQTWTGVAGGLNIPSNFAPINIVSDGDSNQLFVATYTYQGLNSPIKLFKWDGLSWSQAPSFDTTTYVILRDIKIYKGEVYIVTNNFANKLFFKFNGKSWETITPAGFSGFASGLEVINGELHVVGKFTANNGIKDILKYDGVSFSSFPSQPNFTTFGIFQILEYNNEIHINSLDTTFIGSPRSIQKFNAGTSSWSQVAHFSQGTGVSSNRFGMFKYKGDLFLHELSGVPDIYKVNNDTIFLIDSADYQIVGAVEYDGYSYFLYNNSTPSSIQLGRFNGDSIVDVLGTPRRLINLQVFDSSLFVFSRVDTMFNGVISRYVFRTKAGFAAINGNIYNDLNSNCIQDSGEVFFTNAIVKLSNLISMSPNNYGHYSAVIPPGTYNFDTVYFPQKKMKNFVSTCNLPPPFTLLKNQDTTYNFGFKSNVATDLTVTISSYLGWRARLGYTESYKVEVLNTGYLNSPATTLSVTIPPSFSFNSSIPVANSQVGNVLNFNIAALQPSQSVDIFIKATVDTSTNNLFDQIFWNTFLGNVPGDADLSDNADTISLYIVAAFDPNDKTANAEFIAPNTKTIDYHIRFQNTGNDTAYKVTVVDTLDLSLPLSNIVINSASHPYHFSVVNNVLVWEFDDILLPDSSVDYHGSQGYVNFTAGIHPNVGVGDTIRNTAQIYFDFQKPVHTNVAKTVMVTNISVGEERLEKRILKIFPNPANEVLNIENTSDKAVLLRLTDVNGRLIIEQKLSGQSLWQYNVNQLQAGIYFLSAGAEGYKIVVTE